MKANQAAPATTEKSSRSALGQDTSPPNVVLRVKSRLKKEERLEAAGGEHVEHTAHYDHSAFGGSNDDLG